MSSPQWDGIAGKQGPTTPRPSGPLSADAPTSKAVTTCVAPAVSVI
jgi:hypothetical protein